MSATVKYRRRGAEALTTGLMKKVKLVSKKSERLVSTKSKKPLKSKNKIGKGSSDE